MKGTIENKVLLKEIVIPAGTVFCPSPWKITRHSEGCFDCTIGLSDNTSGTFSYWIDDDEEVLGTYFTDLK